MRTDFIAGCLVVGIAFFCALDPAGAEGHPESGEGPESKPAQEISVPSAPRARGAAGPGLDALLQLPDQYRETGSGGGAVAGASKSEWGRRFGKAKKELVEARSGLERTKRDLDAVAEGGGSSQWSVAPPGGNSSAGPATSPLSFKLRQELKRNRDRVDKADRRLRELSIQADLAGVPPDWRGDPLPPMPRTLTDVNRQ